MARTPMVTRSITITQANVLCLNTLTAEPFNKLVSFPRTFKDEKSLMKKVREEVDTDDVKAVHIVHKEESEFLYGMEEQLFIKMATILDPKTRKAIVADEDDEKTTCEE